VLVALFIHRWIVKVDFGAFWVNDLLQRTLAMVFWIQVSYNEPRQNAATVRIASHSALMAMRQTRVSRAYGLDKSHLSRGSAYRARPARSVARNMPIHATIPVCVNTRVCYLITFIPLVLEYSLDKKLGPLFSLPFDQKYIGANNQQNDAAKTSTKVA
jgi:hypothetical protein